MQLFSPSFIALLYISWYNMISSYQKNVQVGDWIMKLKFLVNKHLLLFSFTLTILMVIVVDFFQIPNPNVILLTAIVYLTFLGGYISGAMSGIIVILYSLYFFSMPQQLLRFSFENLKKVIVIIIFIPIMIGIVGTLKKQYLLKTKELELANQELQRIARLDPLTGISNRRYFDEVFLEMFQLSLNKKVPISLLMADIDFFKNYNDNYGHLLGDNCLIKVAQAIAKEINRPGELIARYGGEEFIILLPNTNLEDALFYGNKIINGISSLNIEHTMSSISTHVTISVGVVSVTNCEDITPLNLIERADKALYHAKDNGRNQVSLYVD